MSSGFLCSLVVEVHKIILLSKDDQGTHLGPVIPVYTGIYGSGTGTKGMWTLVNQHTGTGRTFPILKISGRNQLSMSSFIASVMLFGSAAAEAARPSRPSPKATRWLPSWPPNPRVAVVAKDIWADSFWLFCVKEGSEVSEAARRKTVRGGGRRRQRRRGTRRVAQEEPRAQKAAPKKKATPKKKAAPKKRPRRRKGHAKKRTRPAP